MDFRIQILALLLTLPYTASVSADTLLLRHGGSLEADITQGNPRTGYELTTPEGIRVILSAKEVEAVKRKPKVKEFYERHVSTMPDTADAHWEVYQKCKKLGLRIEANHHLQQVYRLEPDHEPARQAGGYLKDDHGKWLLRDELQRQRGFVRYGRQWITSQEAQLRDILDQREEIRSQWKRDLMAWRKWLNGRRAEEARQNILSIEDVFATEALSTLLQREEVPLYKRWYVEVLGRLGGSANQVLLEASLSDPDVDLRELCLEQLRDVSRISAIVSLTSALNSNDPDRVNHAGYGLQFLDAKSAVRPLINALTVTQRVVVNRPNMNLGAERGGGTSFGLSQGGGKAVEERVYHNQSVLNALRHLTGEDFGFDRGKWRNWYVQHNTPTYVDLRRDW